MDAVRPDVQVKAAFSRASDAERDFASEKLEHQGTEIDVGKLWIDIKCTAMDVGEVEKLGDCIFIIYFIFFRPLLLILDDIDTCYMMVYSVQLSSVSLPVTCPGSLAKDCKRHAADIFYG